MATDTRSMTIDYRTIMSIPFGVRQSMVKSGILDSLSMTLTPGQRASLFPSYYKQDMSAMAGQRSVAGGQPEPKFATGANYRKKKPLSPSDERLLRERGINTTGAPRSPASLGTRKATYSRESVENTNGIFTPRERQTLNFIAKREGSTDPNIIYGGERYKAALGLDKKPLTEMTVSEVLEMQKKMTKLTGADGVAGGVGTSAVGTGQMVRGTLIANLQALGIPEKEWGSIKFDRTLQEKLTLQNFRSSGIGDPNLSPNTWDMKRLGLQYESLDTAKGFKPMTEEEILTIASASPELDLQTATQVKPIPSVGPLPTDATADDFYGSMRASYGETLSKDDPIWDQVDPELRNNKHMLVDAETGLVGRDALLSADAAAKVLRKNGYIPRPVSGGDNHSINHGAGRAANYSIDMAAAIEDESGKITNVQMGSGIPYEVKRDMAMASYLASEKSGTNSRIGFPLGDSAASMHIQQDPNIKSASWGYDSRTARGADASRTILETTPEGKKYLSDMEALKGLDKKDRDALFASVTGMTGPTQMAQTTVQAAEMKADETQTASLVPTRPEQASTLPSFYTDPMTAFAGGGEIEQPHMAVPLTSKGDQSNKLIAETGPEKVTPRHRVNASEVGQQSYQMSMPQQNQMQEKPKEVAISEAPSQPTVTTGVTQRPMSVVAVDHPMMPTTARKAYADAKLEPRYNNLSPTGAVYTNHGV